MAISFEVFEKDIAGRLGRLRVGARQVRTPALLPVINPHLQPVTPATMQSLGVEAVITNGYIFSRSREYRDRALDQGLHRVLGFDGVIMTDSGSFQLSVYGDVATTNMETLAFQHSIGSDIIVPLDIPTSPDADRETAACDLAVTCARLAEAREIYGDDGQVAGPVQGGRFADLRRQAGVNAGELGYRLCPIGAVVPLMEQYRYRELVGIVLAAKEGIPPDACVHLFGAGHPSMFALAAGMGCDIFDSAAYALYAKDGRYLTPRGTFRIEELAELPCSCHVCRGHSARELRELPEDDRMRLLALHNLLVSLAEVAHVRQAISEGTLWELIDERCRTHPTLLDGYRTFLGASSRLEELDRATKRRFFYQGSESCFRTEVSRYHAMLSRLVLPPRVVVTIGGNALPGGFDKVLLFKPPFGPYDPDLSETFPIGQSEVPEWDETMVRRGIEGIRALIATHPGSRVAVSTTRRWEALAREVLPGIEVYIDEV